MIGVWVPFQETELLQIKLLIWLYMISTNHFFFLLAPAIHQIWYQILESNFLTTFVSVCSSQSSPGARAFYTLPRNPPEHYSLLTTHTTLFLISVCWITVTPSCLLCLLLLRKLHQYARKLFLHPWGSNHKDKECLFSGIWNTFNSDKLSILLGGAPIRILVTKTFYPPQFN